MPEARTKNEVDLLKSMDRVYQSIDKALLNGDFKAGLIEAKFELRAVLKINDAFLHGKKD